MITEEHLSVIVTIHDCKQLGFCMSKVNPWFAHHGIDFRAFVKDGVDGETLLRTNDQLAVDAVEEALRRVTHGR